MKKSSSKLYRTLAGIALGRYMAVLALLFIVVAAGSAAAQTQSTVDQQWADVEFLFDPVNAVDNFFAPDPAKDAVAAWRMREAQRRRLRELGLKFFDDHPLDIRRWQWLVATVSSPPTYRLDPKAALEAEMKQAKYAGRSADAARRDWLARYPGLRGEFLAAREVTDVQREQLYFFELQEEMPQIIQAARRGDAVERSRIDDFVRLIAEFGTALPASIRPKGFALVFLINADPLGLSYESKARILELFQANPNAGLSTMAAGQANLLRLQKKPMDLKYVALDGREVDLVRLRGKVVLVDFWATWCSNCVAEMPNVKRIYEKYHDRGFEVVGVSVDRAGDRQKLENFIAANALPWPQEFSGKDVEENPTAIRYGIVGVPVMLLLRPDGTLFTSDARGPRLESAVRELLGLH